MANKVKLKTLVEKMNLKNLTPDVDLSEKEVEIPDINRPALQLTGFFEHFDSERVQIIGYVEYTFLEKMTDEVKKKKIYETCFINLFFLNFICHLLQECVLHISYDLHTFGIKMFKESGKLQSRSVNVWYLNFFFGKIYIRCKIFEIHFFNECF